MSVCHLLLWRPTLPYNLGSLNVFQPVRLSPDFLLNFPDCTAAPVSAVAVMVPPWTPKERKDKSEERNILKASTFKNSSVPQALAMARKSVSRTSSFLWRLCTTNLRSASPSVTLTDQDDASVAARPVHWGVAWSSWLCPVQRTASCSTHIWWHHHRGLVLRPSSASRWQGNDAFLCLCPSAGWFLCIIIGIQILWL